MTASILFSVAVFLALLGGYHYLGYRSSKKDWQSKMEEMYGRENKRESMIMVWGNKFDQTVHGQKVQKKLSRANIPLNPSEFYGVLIVGGMGIAVLSSQVFSLPFPINVIIAVIIIEVIRRALFYMRKNKHLEQLQDQLPEICRILANATRSGMTLTQGITLAARELDDPAQDEFKRLSNQLHLGVDFDQALRELQKRIPSREFKLFVATLLIQKKAGGNLHAVLDEMGSTLDERKLLMQEIKSMTAEQKYIAFIVPAIPVFLLLMMNTIIDDFLEPLFTVVGLILLGLFAIGTVIAFFLVRKVTNIRV